MGEFTFGFLIGSFAAFTVALVVASGAFNAVAARLKYLEAAVLQRTSHDVYDDADYWKNGRMEDDEE
jgi:hypothetical protein